MKKPALLLFLALLTFGASAQNAVSKPIIIEYTFWVQKGRASQFSALLKRTELSKLGPLIKSGKIDWMRTTEPLLNQREDGWDLRVTIAWRNQTDAFGPQGFLKPQVHGLSGSSRQIERDLLHGLIVDQEDTVVEESVDPPPGT